jgi:hypothetical protein
MIAFSKAAILMLARTDCIADSLIRKRRLTITLDATKAKFVNLAKEDLAT